MINIALLGALLAAVGLAVFQFTKKKKKPEKEEKPKEVVSAPPKPQAIALQEAQEKAREIIFEARDEAFRLRKAAEEESQKIRALVLSREKKLAQKEEELERKALSLSEKEKALEEEKKEIKEKLSRVSELEKKQLDKLEKVAHLTREEAKEKVLSGVRSELKEEIAKEIRAAEESVSKEADRKAKQLLVEAMQKAVTDYVAEYTVSTVKLPDEEMKGRIIGREGRNIRVLEKTTGVDFDIDETPGEIRLSCFDPVRREIAKVALERLIADGRIQPARIERIVAKTKEDIGKIIHQAGEDLCHKVGVYDLPRDKIDLLGRFKYRFSYGQNMIAHTLEETKLGVALARELKADVNTVRLGCLLHDIGKVITDEEGSHVELGVRLLKRNNISQAVIDCVAEHHQDRPFSSVESVIVYIADAISGARPGARFESLEEYATRLTKLEEIAKSFEGVKEAFAIAAGRELRVIVKAEDVDDDGAVILAREIKKKIEEEKKIVFPGQVKVTVIRETRAVEIAK